MSERRGMSGGRTKPRRASWVTLAVLIVTGTFAVERGAPNQLVTGEVQHISLPKERPQDTFQRARVFNHMIRTEQCEFYWPATTRLPKKLGVKLRIGALSGHCYVQAVSHHPPDETARRLQKQ